MFMILALFLLIPILGSIVLMLLTSITVGVVALVIFAYVFTMFNIHIYKKDENNAS